MNDHKLLEATIEAIVIERPDPEEVAQHLCLDKAYDNRPSEGVCEAAGYVPHIRRIGEEKLDAAGEKRHPARRWVVERTIAWLQSCRGDPDPLRQEARELRGPGPARLRAALVAPAGAGQVAAIGFSDSHLGARIANNRADFPVTAPCGRVDPGASRTADFLKALVREAEVVRDLFLSGPGAAHDKSRPRRSTVGCSAGPISPGSDRRHPQSDSRIIELRCSWDDMVPSSRAR